MDLKNYRPTRLEKGISSFLIQNDILYPEDIRKEAFLDIFHMEIYYAATSYAYRSNNYQAIILKNSETQKEQNYEFYHELGHLLMHYGNQLDLKYRFKNFYQEMDAKSFSIYLAIPFHMLKYIDFSLSNLIEILSDQFLIPENIVVARLCQIQTAIENQTLKYA